MNNRNHLAFVLRWIAPLVVLGCAGFFVYAMGSRPKPDRKKTPPKKSIPVEVIQARPHTGTLDIEASGVAIPFREVVVSARVGGEVVFKAESLNPGHHVKKGEPLLRVDPQDYELQVSRLELEVDKAKVELNRLAIDRENAQRLLKIHRDVVEVRQRGVDRLEALQQTNTNTDAEADIVQLALLTAVQQVTTQESLIRTFESEEKKLEKSRELAMLQLQKARLDLERTEIAAPFTGVVIATHVEQNGHVSPGGNVATIEDTSTVEVRCSLRSQDMPFVTAASGNTPFSDATESGHADAHRLSPVSATVEYQRGGQTYRWAGVLSRQDGLGVDQATRTVPVRIRVSGPNSNIGRSSGEGGIPLVRGMFVKIRLHCQPSSPIVVVPESVLRPGKNVWVMRDGQLQMQKINIAAIRNGQVFIDAGHSALAANAAIISSPVPNARNGLPVSLMSKPDQRKGKPGQGKAKPESERGSKPSQKSKTGRPPARQAAQS